MTLNNLSAIGGIAMPKNVVLCCDGTANEFAEDRTNVVKLFFTLARIPHSRWLTTTPGWARWSLPVR